jgi:hypothetical protein
MMKVLVYPGDNQGTGFHRMIWPALAVSQNPEVQVIIGQAMALAAQSRQPEAALVPQEVAQIRPHVIVFQRPFSIPIVRLMRELQRTGYAIVVDVDDDFKNLPDTNPAWANTAPDTDPITNRENHTLACEFADVLTVSTDSLKESYGGGDRIHVVRNRIPEHWLNVNMPKDDPPAVLWTGVHVYHAGDLEVTDGQVGVALSRAGAKLRHIGGIAPDRMVGPEVEDATNTRGAYQHQGWLNLTEMQWAQAIGRCTAGIVPLCDRVFNHSKSYIKGLEYAALGVPFVASPMPEYKLLAEMGAGELADHPKQWRMMVERLLRDPEWREERAEAGRQVASEQTHAKGAHLWAAAWEQARETARAGIAA